MKDNPYKTPILIILWTIATTLILFAAMFLIGAFWALITL